MNSDMKNVLFLSLFFFIKVSATIECREVATCPGKTPLNPSNCNNIISGKIYLFKFQSETGNVGSACCTMDKDVATNCVSVGKMNKLGDGTKYNGHTHLEILMILGEELTMAEFEEQQKKNLEKIQEQQFKDKAYKTAKKHSLQEKKREQKISEFTINYHTRITPTRTIDKIENEVGVKKYLTISYKGDVYHTSVGKISEWRSYAQTWFTPNFCQSLAHGMKNINVKREYYTHKCYIEVLLTEIEEDGWIPGDNRLINLKGMPSGEGKIDTLISEFCRVNNGKSMGWRNKYDQNEIMLCEGVTINVDGYKVYPFKSSSNSGTTFITSGSCFGWKGTQKFDGFTMTFDVCKNGDHVYTCDVTN